ncbi:hypothetical protein [Spirosoma sp. KNUC1025]|uniref:hypothetical protein n=1 Tax=Spirosoma sp. KNUC1025 TaxID=2894082 RepID=UPI001E42172F|nr:hypothetical protein [Spirosoma sp. KNUC1025]UFH57607.1 hypothetical protein LN737_30435 [Spirosoma sp. KNUC1025]
MKSIYTILLLLIGLTGVLGQARPSTKIYFYSLPSNSLLTSANPDKPIRIGKCTLLETNLDSLGLDLLKDKRVYIHFESGQTYYYRSIISTSTAISATAILTPCAEQDFWLNVYFLGIGTYRHYYLDKEAGLKLLEEKSK